MPSVVSSAMNKTNLKFSELYGVHLLMYLK